MGRTTVRQAARSVTGPVRTHAFAPEELLNALGLEGARPAAVANPTTLSLGEGGWDKPTGGAIAVRTKFSLDAEARLKRLETKYLALNPAGDYTENKLVEFDTRSSGDKLKISKMSFLGRPVDTNSPDAVTRIIGFLQQIHSDIRNLEMPDIGKAFNDFQIAGLMGERMHLPGLSRTGGFDFKALTGAEAQKTQSNFSLPQEFLPELLGAGTNDLDTHQAFGPVREKTGVDRQNGGAFRWRTTVGEIPMGAEMAAAVTPLDFSANKAIPDLIRINWHADKQDAVIDKLVLLGEESKNLPVVTRQKRLGVINAANRDLRRRKYPAFADHMANFSQTNLLDRQAIAGDIDEHPKMVVKVYGGHNAREYLPGFGGTIGGNSKGVLTYKRDEGGEVKAKGVRVDAGITFSKHGGINAGEHGSWDRVLPDPGEDFDNLEQDLVTHLHADHIQAIVDEARVGVQTDRPVNAGEYDWRVLEQFLKKEKIPREQWPERRDLDGHGWIHLDDGKNRTQSIYYWTNAIPHSTPVTGFIIVPAPYKCDTKGKACDGGAANPHYWSYATLGDMSYAPYNLPDYKGETPPDTGFHRDFFSKFKEEMRREYPDIPKSMNDRIDRINVVECDPTSVHREGWAPDVVATGKNVKKMLGEWFPEMGAVIHTLSTAKRQHEGLFRAATELGRNISGEGAFLENRMTDMNVMGVNTDVIPRDPDGGNINKYLEWFAEKIGIDPVKFHRRTSGLWRALVKDHPEKTIFLATGSQGTEVEQDSVGTQIAEGHSRFQLDPKYCRAAYGVDPKKYLHIYAQSAIPGNEDKQLEQLRKSAFENDLMVGVAVHDGARFYNLKEPYLSRIKEDCDRTGTQYTEEPMGGILVHGFSLYPPGHGWKEDWRQGFLPWFKENNVEMISVQHYPRIESVKIMYELADEIGLKHPKEPLPNHVAWTMENGRDFKIIGEFTPSFILARDNRKFGQYYGGTTEYLRAIFPSSQGNTMQSGLFAAENTVYFNQFGPGNYEQMHYDVHLPILRSRRDPERAMTEAPPGLGVSRIMPMRGPKNPLPIRNHAHLEGV